MKKSITAAITRRITTIDMKKIKTPQRPLFSKATDISVKLRVTILTHQNNYFEQELKDEAACSFGQRE